MAATGTPAWVVVAAYTGSTVSSSPVGAVGTMANSVVPMPPVVVLVMVIEPVGVKVLVNVHARDSRDAVTSTVIDARVGICATPLQSNALPPSCPPPSASAGSRRRRSRRGGSAGY